jgi:hypothetical protein
MICCGELDGRTPRLPVSTNPTLSYRRIHLQSLRRPNSSKRLVLLRAIASGYRSSKLTGQPGFKRVPQALQNSASAS